MLVFDCETDGLLSELTTIHCLHLYDTERDKLFRYDKETIPEGIKQLEEADCICGHNILSFDIPAIKKLYPSFNHKGEQVDTLPWARLLHPEIAFTDIKRVKQRTMPKELAGKHKLAAWGYRLGEYKGDFGEETDWQEWSQEMSDYCVQDVMVTAKLVKYLESKPCSEEALQLEFDTTRILSRQIQYGVKFNVKKAVKLYATLCQAKEDIKGKMQVVFKPRYVKDKEFTPKRDNKRSGYRAGCSLTKIKLQEFNPGSRQQIGSRFKRSFGWKPLAFTPKGQPQIDETILSKMPWPEAHLLAEYFTVNKRTGQIAEGDDEKAWLKVVTPEGRIHGYVNPQGAITRRMTHSFPNLAQVPAVKKDKQGDLILGEAGGYGAECRELFEVDPGHILVGCDASGLELRCLAHYMAAYDGGAYAEIVLHGDIHTANQKAAGLATRAQAKRFIYAFLYGAGDVLLGQLITEGDGNLYSETQYRRKGKQVRAKFMAGLPALSTLIERVKKRVDSGGKLKALDGQPLVCRSSHSALNLLLQSAGAIAMKKALVVLDADLQSEGFKPGIDYEFVINCHDELQIQVFNPSNGELVGLLARAAIRKAGEHFNFQCALDGEFKIGINWKETH